MIQGMIAVISVDVGASCGCFEIESTLATVLGSNVSTRFCEAYLFFLK